MNDQLKIQDNVENATPAEIDTELAKLDYELAGYMQRRKQLQRLRRDLLKVDREIEAVRERMRPLDAEFVRRGGWTRAFQVISSDGHIHSSTSCSTTYLTTRWAWIPRVSGMDMQKIVELAGESACTICYPDAPVAVRNRPAQIGSAVERRAEQDKKAKIKADKAVAAAAKAITNPDGTALRVDSWVGVVETESTATRLYVEAVLDAERWDQEWARAQFPADHRTKLIEGFNGEAAVLLAAIAAKHDVPIDEMAKQLEPKVIAKRKREAAEARKAAGGAR